ncbi:hypothetical protein EV2_015072 [Malus domestica]
MDKPGKHQVSLRGASAKEITRDALLEKVSQERELRQYARRATAAALFIQRVWRRCRAAKIAALEFREEWEKVVDRSIQTAEMCSMKTCFQILLESVNSTDSKKNYCSLAIGTLEERRVWSYQSRKLLSLCMFVLSECDTSCARGQDFVALTSLAMRFVVVLTDLKGWKSVAELDWLSADAAVKDLVRFMGGGESGLYLAIRRYISTLDPPGSSRISSNIQRDDSLLITASTITLALRPFHLAKFDSDGPGILDVHYVAEKYCMFLLTIPCLTQRLPAVLISAMRHKSILSPCFQTLLVRLIKFERNKCKFFSVRYSL